MPKTFKIQRAAKFNITNLSDPDLIDFQKSHSSWVNKVNRFIWDLISSKKIDIYKTNSQYIHINELNDRLSFCDVKNKNLFDLKNFISEIGMDDCQVKYIRGVFQYVTDRYKSYIKRNRELIAKGVKKLNYINIRGKEIQLKNQIVSLDEDKNILELDVYLKDKRSKLKLTYDPRNSFLNHAHGLGSSKCDNFGGNLVIDQRVFVACNSFDKVFDYDPKDYLGIDINVNKESWLCLSSAIKGKQVFEKPEDIAILEEEIKLINEKLNSRFRKGSKVIPTHERSFKSKEARKLRIRVKKLHRQQKKLIEKFLEEIQIVDYVRSNKLLLCMDMVACGQTHGTFGQDKITKYLIKQCENNNIPFWKPPTDNSSRACSECGYCDKANRKKQSEFKCLKCGHEENADIQAAKNTGNFGWVLFHEFDWGAPKYEQVSYIKNNIINSNQSKTQPTIGKSALQSSGKIADHTSKPITKKAVLKVNKQIEFNFLYD